MKKSITKNQLKLLKQQRLFEQRIAKKHEKAILNCYVKLAEEIEKKYLKSNPSNFDDEVEEVLKPLLQQTLIKIASWNIETFTEFFIDKFKRTINLDDLQIIKSKLLNKFLNKYVGETVKNVSETTKNILKNKISIYTQEGLNFRDMVKNIVRDTKGVIGINRAKIIARTETSKAISITNFDTAKGAGLKTKTWIYTNGSVVKRKFHVVMNGTTIEIGKRFTVPGEGKVPEAKMRFPKDPECLAAGQIISCSCQIFYT
ncbi:MAG: hypothetical protein ACRCX2_27310 [Paraclostridium sp.]